MENQKTRWNGYPCDVADVLVEILPGEGFFKWWQPYVGKIMKGLKLRQNGQTFVLYNGDGSATRKVLAGGGPNMPSTHFENFQIIKEKGLDVVEIIKCKEHDWSEEEKPIFQTKTKYCKVCRTSEVIEKMTASMI